MGKIKNMNQTIEQLIENTPREDFQFVLPFKLTKKQMTGLFHQVEMKDDRQTIQVNEDILLETRGHELTEGRSPSWIAFEEFVDELYWNIDRWAELPNGTDEQQCGKADCECYSNNGEGLYDIYYREQKEAGVNIRTGHSYTPRETKHTIGYQTKLLINSWKGLLTKVYKLGEVI